MKKSSIILLFLSFFCITQTDHPPLRNKTSLVASAQYTYLDQHPAPHIQQKQSLFSSKYIKYITLGCLAATIIYTQSKTIANTILQHPLSCIVSTYLITQLITDIKKEYAQTATYLQGIAFLQQLITNTAFLKQITYQNIDAESMYIQNIEYIIFMFYHHIKAIDQQRIMPLCTTLDQSLHILFDSPIQLNEVIVYNHDVTLFMHIQDYMSEKKSNDPYRQIHTYIHTQNNELITKLYALFP